MSKIENIKKITLGYLYIKMNQLAHVTKVE
jgi:hypothetical protein